MKQGYQPDIDPLIFSSHFLAKKTMDDKGARRNLERPIGVLHVLLDLENV